MTAIERDVIIIGGGAAGFFAAICIAEKNPKLSITILEKSDKVLSKVRVSGGGRCNVTHHCFDNDALVKNYPRGERELKSAFSRFAVNDIINWFANKGVELVAEADGRMFPRSNTSATIVNCFLETAMTSGVEVIKNCGVKLLIPKNNLWEVATADKTYIAKNIIVASGGYPKLSGYDFLNQTQHTIVAPVASLFTFNIPDKELTQLMGVAVKQATVKIKNEKLVNTGPLLITHWGLSGPAVLKLSAMAARKLNELNYIFSVSIDWLPAITADDLFLHFKNLKQQHPKKSIQQTLFAQIPARLWLFFLKRAAIDEQLNFADLSNTQLKNLITLLKQNEYQAQGKTTFKEEFVTSGGVALNEIDFKTMQSKLHKQLYFAGEVMDVDAVTGGFNFQNAWTSAYIAAQNILNTT